MPLCTLGCATVLMRPDRWRWWRVPVGWLMGCRCAGCGQRRRPSDPLPDEHMDFIKFDDPIARGMHAAAFLNVMDDLEFLAQRYSAMIEVDWCVRLAYIRCRGPREAFLAALEDVIAVLAVHNLRPELLPMDAALRSLRRATRERVRSQGTPRERVRSQGTLSRTGPDSWTWTPNGD